MTYSLTHPMIITSRLLAGVKIGDATLSVQPTLYDGERYSVATYIDTPEGNLYFDHGDLTVVLTSDETVNDLPRKAVESLLSFLANDAESYRDMLADGELPEDSWIFNAKVAAWADRNENEISMLAAEFEDSE